MDSDYSLGFVWLYIGGMRYYLLLGTDDLDPALKYSCKQSQLAQKKFLLELDIQVISKKLILGPCFQGNVDMGFDVSVS